MPMAGFVAWSTLAIAAWFFGHRLPGWAPLVAAAIPFPLAIVIDKLRGEPDLLILGLAILAGMVWVPHGWCADDPAGFVHFVMRAVLCYAAYLFAPPVVRGAAIAEAAALTYIYAIVAMRKPSSVR